MVRDMPNPDSIVDCTLECGHIIQVSYVVFQAEHKNGTYTLHCKYCNAMRLVIEWIQHKRGYGFRCQDCPYTRYYGLAKLTRDVKGSSHAVRKRHAVDFTLNGKIERKAEPKLITNQLALELDKPPF